MHALESVRKPTELARQTIMHAFWSFSLQTVFFRKTIIHLILYACDENELILLNHFKNLVGLVSQPGIYLYQLRVSARDNTIPGWVEVTIAIGPRTTPGSAGDIPHPPGNSRTAKTKHYWFDKNPDMTLSDRLLYCHLKLPGDAWVAPEFFCWGGVGEGREGRGLGQRETIGRHQWHLRLWEKNWGSWGCTAGARGQLPLAPPLEPPMGDTIVSHKRQLPY